MYKVSSSCKSLQDSGLNKGNKYSDYLQQNHNITICWSQLFLLPYFFCPICQHLITPTLNFFLLLQVGLQILWGFSELFRCISKTQENTFSSLEAPSFFVLHYAWELFEHCINTDKETRPGLKPYKLHIFSNHICISLVYTKVTHTKDMYKWYLLDVSVSSFCLFLWDFPPKNAAQEGEIWPYLFPINTGEI